MSSASPKQQLYIAGSAEQTGFTAEAAPIYRRLMKEQAFPMLTGGASNPNRLACYLGLARTGAAGLTTRELAQLFDEFATEFPAMSDVQNDAAYLRPLLGGKVGGSTAVAARLAGERPELLAYRLTAALGELRRRRFAEAARWVEEREVDWATVPERYQVVRVAVLAASGREEEAAKIRASLRPEVLRPEERELAGMQ